MSSTKRPGEALERGTASKQHKRFPDLVAPGALLAHLLETGDQSDLTLKCGAAELKVHQSIVCPQSAVIQRAVQGLFQESTTKVLQVDFDLESLKYMVQFMYNGVYELSDNTETSGRDNENNSSDTSSVLAHIRVNGIADYYHVPHLSNLSRENIESCLSSNWSAATFETVCRMVFSESATGDRRLRDQLGSFAAQHPFDTPRTDVLAGIVTWEFWDGYMALGQVKIADSDNVVKQLEKAKKELAQYSSACDALRNKGRCGFCYNRHASFYLRKDVDPDNDSSKLVIVCRSCASSHGGG